MIFIRHYFPSVDVDSLDEEGFAIIANDAEWLHSQQIIAKQANSLDLLSS